MSHSKRNTSLAFFTSHERAEVNQHWGSRSTRLTRDSFLPFGSCQLCLLPARSPVACPGHGHLFCRECAVSNLLAQGKELKRARKEREDRAREEVEDKVLEDGEERVRDLEEFERTQAGIAGSKKRKYGGDELLRIAKEGDHSRKRLAGENVSEKREAGSFWIPEVIPEHKKNDFKVLKQNPTCPASEEGKAHDFTLKTVVEVRFHEEKVTDGKDVDSGKLTACPSCNKALSNNTKAVLAKPCGHVLCKPCSDKFQATPAKSAHEGEETLARCFVCQEDITAGRKTKGKKEKDKVERGLVEISSDGTGFAAGKGGNMVKKSGVAFQC
ncbi:hypothetical protein LTR10_011948 [Elasticomyces elasticus]|nr:hypothetical protein LTR10_011948 [Elasticomyces elasticus]KAK4968889.1 hypothetical protein LTR42_009168 [Elasticomyces elasticus]